jgi:hypothetical protein
MSSVLKRLRRQGFDLSTRVRGTSHYRVRCSQCEALVINGVPTHEAGCPNARAFAPLRQRPMEEREKGGT